MKDSTKDAEKAIAPTADSPKFNVPTQIDYSKSANFVPIDGSQVLREVVTDTYVTASNSEDAMVERIDEAMTVLKGKIHGFAGYLSFSYLQMTLFYVMKEYGMCLKAVDNIMKGVEAVERYVFTRSYDGVEANGVEMRNYAFGESDEELKGTVKYLHDAWNVAKMVHAKAASFESGFSLIVSEIMLHGYNRQIGMMRKDCDRLRDLVGRLAEFIERERDEEPASGDLEFHSIEELSKDGGPTPADSPLPREPASVQASPAERAQGIPAGRAAAPAEGQTAEQPSSMG